MKKEFKLPDVGEGVAEGEIRKWLVKEGESVREFQPLAEIMTDKVNVEMTSPFTGKILKLNAGEGRVVKVGEVIMEVEVEEETGAPKEKKPEPATPARASAGEAARSQSTAEHIRATPAVRKRARELGVDISTVKPADPSGRVTTEDVEAAAKKGSTGAAATTAGRVPEQHDAVERIPVQGIRRRIFERMAESKRNIPHFSYVDEVDMTSIVHARDILARKYGDRVKVTFLPFIIKAAVESLKEFPYLNASYDDKTNEIVLKKHHNIGVAVATEAGLIVPNIKDADTKSIEQLAKEVEELASKARAGSLSLPEVQGGTFTITNVGPIGGLLSSPVINYPESAILAIHRVQQRPVVRNGQIIIRDMMYFTVACDHRIVDGAVAARFGNRLIEYLEHPFLMKLEF
ncbi:MAG: dihydrolipoamide acetyltransferase family protein [Methanomassiliicoccales archaeon]|nr:dihydrolipoamide acetyltransferase family protein [Methanomassiliicoccales archaeon]